MKPNTNEMLGANRERKFQGQGQGPNWILIAGGALLSTLSIRLGYRLKQVLDSKHPQNTRNGLKENGKVTGRKRAGNCHSQSHSNLYCFEQDDNETEIKPQLNGHQIHSDTRISLPLVTVSAPTYTKENGVMWASSPDRLELPKPFHHSNNSSDSPSVSESGSDIFSKREVIQKLRQQLKRRDDMILEMQDQIAELRNSLTSQHSHSGHLQSQLESANRELFDSEREIQRLRKAIADICVGNGNGYMEVETGMESEKVEMLKREVGELKEVIEGKNYLLQNYKEQKNELALKVKELQHRLDSHVPNIL
ncbi:hypothetical protein LXL04_027488 [Taraxacum kok-saghyz]